MKQPLFLLLICCIVPIPGSLLAADPTPPPTTGSNPTSGDTASAGASADQAAKPTPSADEEVSKPRKTTAGPSAINVIPEPSGLKTLNIHFRWSLFTNSRIEVRLVPGADDKPIAAAPVYFHDQLKGKVQEDFFDCLDHPDNGGVIGRLKGYHPWRFKRYQGRRFLCGRVKLVSFGVSSRSYHRLGTRWALWYPLALFRGWPGDSSCR